MPLRSEGMSKKKAFLYGTLSGAVELVGAVLTILAAGGWFCCSAFAISFKFCGRSNDLCCGGGADPRNVGGKTFQRGNGTVRCRFCSYDDVGCCTGIRENLLSTILNYRIQTA